MGEAASLGVTIAVVRAHFVGNLAHYASAATFGFVIVAAACVALSCSPPGLDLWFAAITLAIGAGVLVPWGIRVLRAYSSDSAILDSATLNFISRFLPTIR